MILGMKDKRLQKRAAFPTQERDNVADFPYRKRK
jgi:hypothetical protein